MTPDTIVMAGLAALATWAIGPQLWRLSKRLLRRTPTTVPSVGQSLQDAVVQLRYYIALQSPDVRERGQEALDVVEGIVSDQPRLPAPAAQPEVDQ